MELPVITLRPCHATARSTNIKWYIPLYDNVILDIIYYPSRIDTSFAYITNKDELILDFKEKGIWCHNSSQLHIDNYGIGCMKDIIDILGKQPEECQYITCREIRVEQHSLSELFEITSYSPRIHGHLLRVAWIIAAKNNIKL